MSPQKGHSEGAIPKEHVSIGLLDLVYKQNFLINQYNGSLILSISFSFNSILNSILLSIHIFGSILHTRFCVFSNGVQEHLKCEQQVNGYQMIQIGTGEPGIRLALGNHKPVVHFQDFLWDGFRESIEMTCKPHPNKI